VVLDCSYSENKIYPHVYEKMEDWPIHKLHQDRKAFIQEITDFTVERLIYGKTEKITEMIGKTAYLEQIRIKEEPWKIDPPNERSFWKKIQKRLVNKTLDQEKEQAKVENKEMLTSIVRNYAEEIVATFKISTFQFARRFLTWFFGRLLNTAASRNMGRLFNRKHRLGERMKISGEIEKVRSLMKKGTVIILPTHHSNLDSVLIGYIMDTFGGLPHFSFAAGLNLYNTGYTAYFINRVGAYRLDRRKKNPIYLETLKAMSNLAIQRGTNCIIFPGGTRSRSGHLEKKLKMGMMGTAVEAQRALAEKGKDEKIFIVPVVVGYHFVLEAPFLIENHLRQTGKERYINVKDSSYSLRKVLRFAWNYFSNGSEILLTFGKPLDVLGNFVNEEGESKDQYGNPIDIKDYFIKDGVVKADLQRDKQYTKILADRVVERFFADNVVLSSHAIAYLAFNLIKTQNTHLDLYGLLRLPSEDYVLPMDIVVSAMEELQTELKKLEQAGKANLSKEIHLPAEELIREGIKFLGVFHAQAPLKINKEGNVISESFKLLYFYHNRLDHYDLHETVNWSAYKIVEKTLIEV